MEKGTFFSYSWNIEDKETNRTVIRIYGLNEKNENVCVIVNNFTPYIYLELPENIVWDTTKAQLVVSKLDEILKDRKPVVKQLMFKKRLYYANMDEKQKRKLYPYILCCFSHTEDIKQLGYKTRRPLNIPRIGDITVRIHEHNASPILQLTSVRKIPTAGWINFVGKRISKDDQVTYCTHEYIVSWKNLEEKKSDVVARPLCMSFDLEVNSSIPTSMPKAVRLEDKIFQISCIFHRQGAKQETYEKILLTLGEPDMGKLGDGIGVLMFKTEPALLLGFTNLIQERQPNIIMGYNIFGFDIPYMIERAKNSFCIYDFDKLGMDRGGHAREKSISWSSSAYKNQSFQFLDAEGRLFVDLLPLVKRDYKMSNYKLDTIAGYFLKGVKKDPLDAKGIFECYRLGMLGGTKGMKALGLVGRYCVQDSFLVTRLFEVLTIWVALCEMSKVTNVPIFSLYTQGQQLKVFSQTYKKCTHENIVVEKDGYIAKETDHYVGATVFPPVAGVYDKVIPLDFSSLYPSTIIAYNLCWSTLVTDDNIPDEMCNVMIWRDDQGCEHDPKVIRKKELNEIIKTKEAKLKELRQERDLKKNKDRKEEFAQLIDEFKKEMKPLRDERANLNKSKPKHIICCERKFRWLKSPMGVLPEILTHLLDTRAITKKEMKGVKAKLKEMKDIGLDEDDVKYSELATYCDVLDQRQLALKVSANSVPGETPIPCKIDEKFCYRTIEQLSLGNWSKDNEGNELATPIPNLQVWSDKGFTKVKYIFRHVQNTKIKRINTHIGCVDCTEHHSLLFPDGCEVKPTDLKIGDKLMHKSLPSPNDTPINPLYKNINIEIIQNYILNTKQEKEAFIWGLFFAQGSCDKDSWTIHSQNKSLLERVKGILKELELQEFIYESGSSIREEGFVRHLFYSENKVKKIPDNILVAPVKIRQAFFMGYCSGDSYTHNKDKVIISNKGSIGTAGLFYLTKSLGYKVSVSNCKNNIYVLECSENFQIQNHTGIKNIINMEKNNGMYVYDIGTENNHFAAGIGDIIVHNSAYGATGTAKGYLPCMPVAMATTYMGRKAIEKAAMTVQKDYGGKLVYGDSVTPDTPILCFLNGLITYKSIETISDGKWVPYHGDKEVSLPLEGMKVWTEKGFTDIKKVIRHKCKKKIYKVTAGGGSVDVTEDHSLLDENSQKITPNNLKVGSKLLVADFPCPCNYDGKICEDEAYVLGTTFSTIPDDILNGRFSIREAFMKGFRSKYRKIENQLVLAGLYFLDDSLEPRNSVQNIVEKIELLDENYDGFVYDLETENHHFSAGVGKIIVHNTDSNYVSFPHLKTAAECWDHAIVVAKEVSKLFPKPMSLAFEEKIYWKYMILTKKRYMSLACERDGKVDNKISKKGVLLQRRDTCDFVRKIYGDVVMMIFNRQERDDILYYIIQELNKLCSCTYPIKDFIVTKSVGNMGYYEDVDNEDCEPELTEGKNDKGKVCWKIGDYTVKPLPTDEKKRNAQFKLKNCNTIAEYYLHCFPAQAQLAYKMRSRGQLVSAGSRIEYVITMTGGHLAKQYVKVESSDYFIKHRTALDLDYLYYLKQLTNPLDQVLDVMYDKDDAHQYRFSPQFMLKQYKYRYQVREKVMNELRSLFTPKIKIIEKKK